MKKTLLLLLISAGSYNLMAQVANPTTNSGNSDVTVTTFVALPVLDTYVPQDIISKMINKYGNDLYDITTIVGTTDKTQYVVRLIKNGEITTDLFDANGDIVSK